jgi:hypothetical protein
VEQPRQPVGESARTSTPTHSRRGLSAATGIFALTVGQLAIATFVSGLSQFEGKGFGARLVAYPVLMAAVPAWWLLLRWRRGDQSDVPWWAFSLLMAPFLVDVTGNSLNLYDTLPWWDDANHFVNWLLLCSGFGLLLTRMVSTSRWLLVVAITGLGALLAIAWELGEWYAFIRHGTELDTAYQDTLGDEALGTAGALVAALLVTARRRT